MELYLIRHAESENNARPQHERVDDPHITPTGWKQSEALADWLLSLQPHRLITSPFRRALQTAAPTVARLQPKSSDQPPHATEVHVWDDLFERGGCFAGWDDGNIRGMPGLGHDGILDILPNARIHESIHPDGWWQSRPREQDAEAIARAARVRGQLEQTLGTQPTRWAIISHADFIRLLLTELLGDQGVAVDRLGPIYNVGITRLHWHGTHWEMHWFNAVTHLPHHLIVDPSHQMRI